MDGIFSSIVQMYLKSIVKVYLRKMGLKSFLFVLLLTASNVYRSHRHRCRQRKLLKSLVRQGYHVHYLKTSRFHEMMMLRQSVKNFLLLTMRISAIILIEFVREKDVLWRGLPKYWAKTSNFRSQIHPIDEGKYARPFVRLVMHFLF